MSKTWPFPGTARFEVRRCLGAGGFGTVYEALDRKRNALIALKVLRQASPNGIYRFKQEFRSLCGITHRNLVTLYELLTEAGEWFFSMELVEGCDFIAYHRGIGGKDSAPALLTSDESLDRYAPTVVSMDELRPLAPGSARAVASPLPRGVLSPSPLSIERLLGSLRQLAEGLLFLHDQEMIHRDIKPANVLCTPLGRVVLLDFGLAEESLPGLGRAEPAVAGIAGTPDYMSPEQALAQQTTVAADWYAVGVLLYEVISGHVPFSGNTSQVLRQKVSQEAPPLTPLERDGVPEDLYRLCMQLLSREPKLRPTGKAVLACICELESKLGSLLRSEETRETAPVRMQKDEPPRSEALLIGREGQLADLADAFAESRQGRPVVALCRGESGAGKSALCKRFLKDLVLREPEVVVWSGRCHAHEDVPYKALDGVVDALSRFLSALPREETEALLPSDIPAVARLFPVLLQVAAIREAPPRRIADDLQAKQVAAAALRELVFRVSEKRPVVMYIDDLQWGDQDGISLLLELLRPPNQPRLLLIAAYRSDEEASSIALSLLCSQLAGELEQRVTLREVPVDTLSVQAAAALALRLLPPAAKARAALIASESGGNPFFISELCRSCWSNSSRAPASEVTAANPLTLDELIRARVERLPQVPRRLLSVIAVAGQPLPRAAMVLAACADAAGTDEPQALALLRSERLIRIRHTQAGPQVAALREEIFVYHDRIREAVVAGLLPSDVAAQHLRLAQALLSCGQAEPEQMVFHLQHGGDLGGAARYAVQASAQAYNALAYHRAVRLCRAALLTSKLSPADELSVRARLADALVGAGHPKEAAETYLELAKREPAELMFKRQRQAAKQLFISGHIQEGYQVLERLLPAARIRIPKTSFGLFCSLIFYQLLIAWRGLEFEERTEAEVSAADLLRIDTCEAIASSTAVNPLLAAKFWTELLWYALRAGEPRRIVLGLAGASGLLSAFGIAPAHVEKLLARALALAERQGDFYGMGRSILVRGQLALFAGKWRESLAELRRATELLRGECMDSTAVIDFIGISEILALRWMGVFPPLAEKLQPYLKDAIERGRISHELNARLIGGFLLLLRDDVPDRAEAFVRAARLRLGHDVSLPHLCELDARLLILLYKDQAQEAWSLFSENRQKMERSGLLRVDLFRTIWNGLAALLALASCQPAQRVETEVQRLLRSRCVFAVPMSRLYLSLLRFRQGRRAESLLFIGEAEAGFAACDMSLHAACARFRRGQWLSGAAGELHQRAAREWMVKQGICNPERMAAMLVPNSGPSEA